MGEYFIPLKTLLSTAAGLPLDKLPLLEPLYDAVLNHVGVRNYRESWNDTHVTIDGEAVLDGEAAIPFGGFALVFGKAGAGATCFDFQIAAERRSVLKAGIDAGVEAIVGTASEEEDVDQPLQMFLQMDAFPNVFRITLSGSGMSLRLPLEHAKLGEKEENGSVIGIKRVTPEKPVDIELPAFLLTIDTEKGIDLTIPQEQVLNCPPFLIGDSDLGVIIKNVKLDMSAEKGFAEVIARPGYDETWKGIYAEELQICGLNTLLPFLPASIDAKNWICGTEGWSGAVDISEFPATKKDDVWQLAKLGIEFDRGSLVRGTFSVLLHVEAISSELWSLGPEGTLELLFTLRHNPSVKGAEAWGFDIALLTPGTKDRGILTLNEDVIDLIMIALPTLMVGKLCFDDNIDQSSGTPILLLWLLACLQKMGCMVVNKLTLDAIRFRYFSKIEEGEVVRFIEVVFDIQFKLSIDLNIPLVLVAKTGRPIGVDIKGLTLQWILGWDSKPQPVKDKLEKLPFKVLFEPQGGISFDLSEQSLIQDSFLEIIKFGIGKWERGLWFDIGVRSTQKLSDAIMGGAAVRLYYLPDGTLDHLHIQGISITILVPNVIYCRAELGWGEVKQVWTHAMLIGNPYAWPEIAAIDPNDPLGKLQVFRKRSSWLWDAEVLLRWEKIDGVTSLVAGINFDSSIGIPLFGSGVSIFGLLGQYANDAAPVVPDGDYRYWFMEKETKNSVLGLGKWGAKKGEWGFGIGAVLGSTAGQGRIWNAKVGLTLLLPGPVVIIYGAANILKQRPTVGNTTTVGDTEGADFVALIVLDLEEDTITVGITIKYSIPKDDGRILTFNIPTEIFVDFGEDPQFHLYIGKDKPMSERIVARALSLFDINGYLMFDTKAIENLAGSGINIPSFAIALGGRGEWQWGLKGKRLKCYFYVALEFNVGVGLPDPWLFYGMIRLEGGLVVKVFGFGFEFCIYAQLTAIAPNPHKISGEVGISIDLPWPLPDVNASISLTPVDKGGSLPAPGSAVNSLTILPRIMNQPIEIQPSEMASGISIDPILSLVFRFPIRNESTSIGSFNFDSVDMQTKYITSGEHGYIFTLTDLTLTNVTTGTVMSNIPAKWRLEDIQAPGEQKARMVLDINVFDHTPSSRFIGTSAKYMDRVTEKWQPCPPSRKYRPVCYGFAGKPPGHFDMLTLKQEGHPSVKVLTLPPPKNADILISTFDLILQNAEVLPFFEAISIPGTYGAWSNESGIVASETLVLEFESAKNINLYCCCDFRSKDAIFAHFYNGATLLGSPKTYPYESSSKIINLIFEHPGPATRVELTFLSNPQARNVGEIMHSYTSTMLLGLCLAYESELVKNEQNQASKEAWSGFWSDLLSQNAASSDALLLDPGCSYELKGRIQWSHLKDDPSTGEELFSFSFTTEAKDRVPQPLRKRNLQIAASDDFWEIDVLPSDGTYSMYTTRPIRLTFSDLRIEAVYAKFDQKLVLRLLDDSGQDLFNRLKLIRETAPELPEYKKVWLEKVLGYKCTPEGVKSLWDVGVAVFDTILKPNREYNATIYSVPISVNDFVNATWEDFAALYNFKFRTSRWKNLTDHVAAHVMFDEILGSSPDFSSISSILGARTLVRDDQVLDEIVFDKLGLPFRKPAASPEVVLIWQKDGSNAYAAIGLFLDGPEPLLREDGSGFSLMADGGSKLEFYQISGKSGARSLLLFSEASAFKPLGPGSVKLTITDVFIDSGGMPTKEIANIVIPVPSIPSIFSEGA